MPKAPCISTLNPKLLQLVQSPTCLIIVQVLPKRFGGDAELVPVHEACQMQRRQSSLAALKKHRTVEHKRETSTRVAGAGRLSPVCGTLSRQAEDGCCLHWPSGLRHA